MSKLITPDRTVDDFMDSLLLHLKDAHVLIRAKVLSDEAVRELKKELQRCSELLQRKYAT